MSTSAPKRRSARICLVVDNPLRDLEGIVLVAWHLARSGAEVYLVPMYDQGTAVLGLEPDAVVVNYARATNRDLMQTYSRAGIMVSVLDTEGGIVDSVEEYATSINRNGTAPFVDQMLMWGPLQYDAFATHSGLSKDRLVLVGCPRMDFCSPPWRDTLPRPSGVPEPFVLVNTNFSLVNPRFSESLKQELATTLHAGFSGWDSAYIERLAKETRAGMDRVIAAVADLATALPAMHFVVRPHPFENPEAYRFTLKGLRNIQVRLEGAVMSWIHASAAVLHLNCGSAVEAALMEKTAINLEWLNTEALTTNAPFPREISHLTRSPEDMKSLLEGIVAGKGVAIPPAQREASLKSVQRWFYNGDGQAAERAADAILRALAQRAPRAKVVGSIRRAALIGAQRRRPLLGVMDMAGKMLFGPAYQWFRNEVASGSVARGTRSAKTIQIEQVNAILTRLAAAREFGARARGVRWAETFIPGQARTSVFVAPLPPGTTHA